MKYTRLMYRKISLLVGLLALAALILAACSPAAAPQPTATSVPPAATTAPTATVAPTTASVPVTGEAEVDVATDAKLGKILVDSKGMTLYAFTKDTADKSNCAGGCLKAWPPLLSQGSPKAGEGVDKSMLGTATLADGTKIVTYNHIPLYLWVKDQKPGDTTGQNVNNVWFVVSPEGKIVNGAQNMPMATTAPSASGAVLNVASDPKLGKILVDGKGMTLYMFKKDTADMSNCTGGCLKAWPPFTTTGSVTAGDGVDQSMIGNATLADGSKIVTYNHMPLYYFVKDMKQGDTNGQGVNNVWYVVGPDGKTIETAGSSSSGAAPAAGAVVLNVATDPKLGQILVDGKGMTLYMFKKDAADTSNCTGGCLKAWPPFTAAGQVTAGTGVDQSKIGSATLADGSKIVTYNHMPLYYWQGDTKSGDTTGQGVQNVWYVVNPNGQPVMGGSGY